MKEDIKEKALEIAREFNLSIIERTDALLKIDCDMYTNLGSDSTKAEKKDVKMQCGHFQSRKHYSTRWDERNVAVQCAGCNVFRYGEQFKFSLYLGVKLSEELLQKSRETVKFADVDLLEMIENYSDKVKKLLL